MVYARENHYLHVRISEINEDNLAISFRVLRVFLGLRPVPGSYLEPRIPGSLTQNDLIILR